MLACRRLFLVALLAAGCRASHVDIDAEIRFDGLVTDANGQGLSGVRVYFLNRDRATPASATIPELLIGETDAGGRLQTDFRFARGYRGDPHDPVLPGTIGFLFRRDGFRDETVTLSLSSLPQVDSALLAPVTVLLKETQ